MLMCDCGGLTSDWKLIHRSAVLTYQRCRFCGRCDCWRLTVCGRDLLRGVEARLEFLRLGGGENVRT